MAHIESNNETNELLNKFSRRESNSSLSLRSLWTYTDRDVFFHHQI